MIMGTCSIANYFIYRKNVSVQLEAAQADSAMCSAKFSGYFRNRLQRAIHEPGEASGGRPVRQSLC